MGPLELRHARFQLGNRHLAIAFDGALARKHGVGIDRDHRLLKLQQLIPVGLIQLDAVRRAVFEHQLNRLLAGVDQHAPLPRQIELRIVRRAVVGHDHVAPAEPGRHLARVNHDVGEVLEEHARLHLAFRHRGDDPEGNFSERLICRRKRDNHDIGGGRGAEEREEDERPQQTREADAAGLERHDFAVSGEASEGNQHADEQRHGNRDAERLRHQRDEHARHDAPRHALGDEPFALLDDRRNLQRKGQHQQRDRERREELAQQIAIESPQHHPIRPHDTT